LEKIDGTISPEIFYFSGKVFNVIKEDHTHYTIKIRDVEWCLFKELVDIIDKDKNCKGRFGFDFERCHLYKNPEEDDLNKL